MAGAKVRRTIDGKFNSIGGATDQLANRTLAVKLVAKIGSDGERYLSQQERTFLADCRVKLNDPNTGMFNWRQVQELVRMEQFVAIKRRDHGNSKTK